MTEPPRSGNPVPGSGERRKNAMKVIICGAGQVGYGIAERLSQEDNDVAVIDTSASLVSHITETLDVRGYVGHGAHPDVLARAGAETARQEAGAGRRPGLGIDEMGEDGGAGRRYPLA